MGQSGAQNLCLSFLIVGGAALLAGSAAPYWVTIDAGPIKTVFGLWFACGETAIKENTCEHYSWTADTPIDFSKYFYIAHAGAGLASLLTLVIVPSCIVKLCAKNKSAKGVAVAALISGMLGIAAFVVFYLKTASSLGMPVFVGNRDWAFFTFAGGSCLLALFGLILLAIPTPKNTIMPC